MARRSFDNDNSVEARQALLDRRCERVHPKRHRTRKRSRRISEMKRQKAAQRKAINDAAQRRFHAAAKQYWNGERESHP